MRRAGGVFKFPTVAQTSNRGNTVPRPELSGKIIIVTGGGRGLGRAMALGFARAGAAGITVTASRSMAEIESVAREIDDIAGPGHGLAVGADVTSWRDCRNAVDRTLEKFSGLHVLVNNAGRGARAGGGGRPRLSDPGDHRARRGLAGVRAV